MTLHEVNTTPAPERIPFLVKEAVKLVGVEEYLKIRIGYGQHFSSEEMKQLLGGAKTIDGFSFDVPVAVSLDPRVVGARQITKRTQLDVFLKARRDFLVSIREQSQQKCILCESEEYQTVWTQLDYQFWSAEEAKSKAELAVIDKVAEAGKIKIDA
ncbi:hypothetical protein COU86_05905 [Candidatus Roizmanbacteria bacterium CG10_big_fil_rev_8_21_14_0_10_36_26]|uniref:Uncharacterized protein n=1 Tax=Candidatus Roizmanbacteria bacterium CG10_big_fil_rev_8_21_14_0_10_36_26 TaxID=1974851 RepID=A0A2M8KJR1_9BACT|nr:MAG: hypothetical protein COU86_05905 [Candidatus Roizmanbacteria bacterium CG10_big_fil_rev_8_21_14_0_10_36_26]